MDFKTDHVAGFRVQLRQVEALIEYMALGIIVAFILGLAAGIILGASWPSTR